MYRKVLERSIGKELSFSRERVFQFFEENLRKKEELSFILPLLSDILDRNLSFYFFPEVRMSYGLTWEKIDEIKERALKTVEKRFEELYEIAATHKEEKVREEALYILIKFLPETNLSFKHHIRLSALLIENLLRKREERLSLKGALRHDLKEVVEEAYGKVEMEVEVYPKLSEKLTAHIEKGEREAEAYLLISNVNFKKLPRIAKLLIYSQREKLIKLIEETLDRDLEKGIISEPVVGYFESVASRKREEIPDELLHLIADKGAQSRSSFDFKEFSSEFIKSDTVFLQGRGRKWLTLSKDSFKSESILSFSDFDKEERRETKKLEKLPPVFKTLS